MHTFIQNYESDVTVHVFCDLTSIELKVIEQFVQITYSCLKEAVHAGLKQRALGPHQFLEINKKICYNSEKRTYDFSV